MIIDEDAVTLNDDAVLEGDAVLKDDAYPEADPESEIGCSCCPVFVKGIKGPPKPFDILNFDPQQPGSPPLQQNQVVENPSSSWQGMKKLKRCGAAFPSSIF